MTFIGRDPTVDPVFTIDCQSHCALSPRSTQCCRCSHDAPLSSRSPRSPSLPRARSPRTAARTSSAFNGRPIVLHVGAEAQLGVEIYMSVKSDSWALTWFDTDSSGLAAASARTRNEYRRRGQHRWLSGRDDSRMRMVKGMVQGKQLSPWSSRRSVQAQDRRVAASRLQRRLHQGARQITERREARCGRIAARMHSRCMRSGMSTRSPRAPLTNTLALRFPSMRCAATSSWASSSTRPVTSFRQQSPSTSARIRTSRSVGARGRRVALRRRHAPRTARPHARSSRIHLRHRRLVDGQQRAPHSGATTLALISARALSVETAHPLTDDVPAVQLFRRARASRSSAARNPLSCSTVATAAANAAGSSRMRMFCPSTASSPSHPTMWRRPPFPSPTHRES